MSKPTSGAPRTCSACKGSIAADDAFCPYCRTRQRPLERDHASPEPWDVFDITFKLLAPVGLALMILAVPQCEQELEEMQERREIVVTFRDLGRPADASVASIVSVAMSSGRR